VTAEAARVLWTPRQEDRDAARITAFTDWLRRETGRSFDDYESLRQWSVADLPGFWAAVWEYFEVAASAPYQQVLTADPMPRQRWFTGARLNYAEHVLRPDRGARPAVIGLAEDGDPVELSWDALRGQVGALAWELRRLGVRPGDRVAGYLPNIPAAVVAMLATTSLGAVWACCAPDFGTRSVLDRLGQVEPTVLIAVDGYRYDGREHDRRDVVRRLVDELPTVRATVLVRSLRPEDPASDGLVPFDEIVAEPREPRFDQLESSSPLWILFSSGTTGLPKGIVQSHAGILLEHLKSLALCLDLGPDDRYFFHSSTSWMAWNYLVGGLLHGSTIVVYSGSPTHGGQDGLWRLAADVAATVLGMGAAYASACAKAGTRLAEVGDLSALRVVIPTGSPLPLGGWDWLAAELPPRVRIDALCGGTDVCTVFFGGSPLLPVRRGEISCRWLGVDAHAVDEAGRPVLGAVGESVLAGPMPSMPVAFWNDPDGRRYLDSYFDRFPGLWWQGDWITITAAGTVTVLGRSDATLNRGGVRLGSADVYTVVEGLPEVADSLVVGIEHPDGEYSMPLFVVPAPGCGIDHEVRRRIVDALRSELSPRHVPDEIVVVPGLPRTLTGKKLEVPIKRILQGAGADQTVALGSVDRPDLLAFFERRAASRAQGGGGVGDADPAPDQP
jgi:acetoacetyl-CoA synthetase